MNSLDKKKIGRLFIVGTPIGNLGDTTHRALQVLRDADYILTEDTRVTQKLCAHFEIKKPLIRCDEYARESLYEKVLKDIQEDLQIAFVSDAGTPGVADPVAKLVSFLINKKPDIPIIPIPGASAVTTILSASGVHANQFIFLGYPPHKKGRETFFREAQKSDIRPIVFFESPHRFLKALDLLKKFFGENAHIVVGRELTKIHEEIFRGNISEAQNHFVSAKIRGEFVVVII